MSDFKNTLDIARKQYDHGNFRAASKTYLSAVRFASNNKETAIIWAELCWTFYRLNSWQQALEAAENVLTYNPDYAARDDIYRLMGYCYTMLGDEDKAEKFMHKSLQIDNESEKQHFLKYELGKLYFKQQRYALAQRYFEEIEEYLKDSARDYWLSLLYFKGFILYYQKKIDESEKVFDNLLNSSVEPERQAMASYGLAYIAFQRKDYLKTINLCEAITRIQPNFFDMETLGFLTAASFFYLGRYDVFEKYTDQMQHTYKPGRYNAELDDLKKQVPGESGTADKN